MTTDSNIFKYIIRDAKEWKLEIPVNNLWKTNGTGYWSSKSKNVLVTKITCKSESDLKIYFNTSTWNIDKDGLIYTDGLFMEYIHEFMENFVSEKIAADIDYSEQGMQGKDYVSCDAYALIRFINKNIKTWEASVLNDLTTLNERKSEIIRIVLDMAKAKQYNGVLNILNILNKHVNWPELAIIEKQIKSKL